MTRLTYEWACTVLVGGVCLGLLAGVVAAAGVGANDYPGTVVRFVLLGASAVFVTLLFRPVALSLDRRVVSSLVFAALACLAALLSPRLLSSLARLEIYYAIVVIGLASGLALPRCLTGTRRFILLAIVLVHAVFLCVALQFAHAAVGDPDPVYAPPFFLNVRHFGYHGFFGASAAVALAVADERLRTAGILLATAALFGIVVFGSRGALIAWLVFVVVAFALVPDRRLLVMVCLVALAGGLALAAVAERQGWFNTISLFDRAHLASGNTASMLSMRARLEIWKDTLPAIAHRPVLGYGPEGYQISRCCNANVVQAHNSVLQVLLEFGIAGLATLAWAVAALFGPAAREITGTAREKREPVRATALAIIAGYAAFSLIDGLLYYPVPLLNFALVCAIFLAARPGEAPLAPRDGNGSATRFRAS